MLHFFIILYGQPYDQYPQIKLYSIETYASE